MPSLLHCMPLKWLRQFPCFRTLGIQSAVAECGSSAHVQRLCCRQSLPPPARVTGPGSGISSFRRPRRPIPEGGASAQPHAILTPIHHPEEHDTAAQPASEWPRLLPPASCLLETWTLPNFQSELARRWRRAPCSAPLSTRSSGRSTVQICHGIGAWALVKPRRTAVQAGRHTSVLHTGTGRRHHHSVRRQLLPADELEHGSVGHASPTATGMGAATEREILRPAESALPHDGAMCPCSRHLHLPIHPPPARPAPRNGSEFQGLQLQKLCVET